MGWRDTLVYDMFHVQRCLAEHPDQQLLTVVGGPAIDMARAHAAGLVRRVLFERISSFSQIKSYQSKKSIMNF